MVKTGIGTFVAFGEETTWGTAVATPNYLDSRPGMESLEATTTQTVVNDISEIGSDKDNVLKGPKTVAGNVTMDLRFNGTGWPMFLSHLCGKDVATTGSGPYVHTITVGADKDITAKGITIHANREGVNAAGASQAYQYIGMRPTKGTLSFPGEGVATASFDCVGKDQDFTSLGTYTATTFPFIKLPSDDSTATTFMTYNSVAYKVKSFELSIEQPVEERRQIEDSTNFAPADGGPMVVTGSFDVEVPDTTSTGGGAFNDDHHAQAFREIVVTVDGPTKANNSLAITLGKCLVTNTAEAHVGSAGLQTVTVNFRAFRDGSTKEAVFALTNASATAWD